MSRSHVHSLRFTDKFRKTIRTNPHTDMHKFVCVYMSHVCVCMYIYLTYINDTCSIITKVIHKYCKKQNITKVFKVHVKVSFFHWCVGASLLCTSLSYSCVQRHHLCSVKSSVIGVFTPWKSENITNQGPATLSAGC